MSKPKHTVLPIQHWRTTSGVPVYFVHTPEISMLDVRVIFQAGSARDEDALGVAELTCALLDEGTQQLSADEIAQRFDAVGAHYGSAVRQDSSSVSLRSLTEPHFLTAALDIFTQVLTQPIFSQEAFERVRKQMLVGLEDDLQRPAVLAQNAFYAALYPKHPYGHPVSGTLSSLNQLTREAVLRFYQQHYVASNALIALVGNVDTAQAHAIAEQLVGSLPLGKAVEPLETAQAVPVSSETIHFPSQQTTIYIGQVGIAPADPDYFPLMVGNYTLGSGGMVSRLFHEVREQAGLVYGVHSTFMPLLARGPFALKLQTRNEEAQHAMDLACSVLEKFIQEGPTDVELSAAQKNILGGFPLELSSNANILLQLVRIGFYHLPLDYLDTYRDQVAAVTEAQIRAAFQKHLQLEQLVKVRVGQQNSVVA
jgi:zinc protease